MSVMTYTAIHDESKGQATCMDARRDKDASVFQTVQAAGGISAATRAARREDRNATFPSDAINWPKMPRIAHPGRERELANCLSN